MSFSNAPAGWTLYIDNVQVGTVGQDGAIGPISERVGSHSFQFVLPDSEQVLFSGTFSIGACPPPPTPTPTPTPTATPTPSGAVLGETATPQITPPPTDTIGPASRSTGSGLPLVLAAGSILLLVLLAVTPTRKRSRR